MNNIKRIVKTESSKTENNQEPNSDPSSLAGSLVVTEFHKIQPPKIKYGRIETILLRHFDAQSQSFRIAFQLVFTDQDDVEYSQTISQDEIDSLASALIFIAQNRQKMLDGAQTYTQLRYESRSGFGIGMYFGSGEVGEYMLISDQTVFLLSLDSLQHVLNRALEKAKSLSTTQW